MNPVLSSYKLGSIRYQAAWRLQEILVAARRRNDISDTLLLLEHPPVITAGRRAKAQHMRIPRERLADYGIEFIHTNRGGSLTYHGPGQLVGYLIADLKELGRDIRRFVKNIQYALIALLEQYGVTAGCDPEHPGVWIAGQHKIAAIGIAVCGGITMHGFALNVKPSLQAFRLFDPCGLSEPERTVTSLAQCLSRDEVLPSHLAEPTARAIAAEFGWNMQWSDASKLKRIAGADWNQVQAADNGSCIYTKDGAAWTDPSANQNG